MVLNQKGTRQLFIPSGPKEENKTEREKHYPHETIDPLMSSSTAHVDEVRLPSRSRFTNEFIRITT